MSRCLWLLLGVCCFTPSVLNAGVHVVDLRCEYLSQPLAIEDKAPRLSWRLEADDASIRGQKQTAYRILAATSEELLVRDQADLWDSGKITEGETLHIEYHGKGLRSGQRCYWKVQSWNQDGKGSPWSSIAFWQAGLVDSTDWKAEWIAFEDKSPVHADRAKLALPPARYYRRDFSAKKSIRRATAYASALGNYQLYLNGIEVSDGYFLPGWSDYLKRAYYQAVDVTSALNNGENCVGAIVTEGWYAGYVGYGLLVGYGPNKAGKNFYGKTPALFVQIEVEYVDGTRESIVTDPTWSVSNDGPIREADIIMGEAFDATKNDVNWCQVSSVRKPSENTWKWEPAIPAASNGSTKATYSDAVEKKVVELGFQKPFRMQAYTGNPVRAVQELPTKTISEPKPGVYIFDLGQNFAGVIRLKVNGRAGQQFKLRYGEMLHPDGRLMTENLRRARATDFYTCNGNPDGETWTPQFTYHGFQYVEVTGFESKPKPEAVTGIVLTSDMPYESSFACSDNVLTQFWLNGQWTQKANFVEIPTDCPQRDERLGWMGDAQAYVRTASYNADIAAFFTKWLDDLEEAQRDFGAYPDYAPYPMAHGGGKATHGTAWTDAGIICPWTIWKVYGDERVIQRHWASMTRFMDWRLKVDPELKGIKLGNPWGDWLNVNENTPVEYIDLCYHAYDCLLMAELADAISKTSEAEVYISRLRKLQANFREQYVKEDDSLKVETQSAVVLAVTCGLIVNKNEAITLGKSLVSRIEANGNRMATGFLGTKSLLPALSQVGQHDLACKLFQSRQFPSWGYEASNGATSVWERWDSYTKEHGFDGVTGKNNAAMNSFSHYAFGAVMEWAYRDLAGIESEGDGFKNILIKPGIPSDSMTNIDPSVPPIHWAKADYMHQRGMIRCQWRRLPDVEKPNSGAKVILIDITLPPNTQGRVLLPTKSDSVVTESQRPLSESPFVKFHGIQSSVTPVEIESGTYHFEIR
jgi:alpha-L-rhamnosidase